MEQARLMLLGKRTREHFDESWEEKAFAQDVNEMLGGCVWPQRYYTCSFCKREFRSAQALGGHMNVHRRDRAKLKLFSTPSNSHTMFDNPHQSDFCNDQQMRSSYTPLRAKKYGQSQEFCFDFQNPNLVLLSFDPYGQKSPSFSSTTNEFQGMKKGFCQMNEKQEDISCLSSMTLVSKGNPSTLGSQQDNEDEHGISEVNGLKCCSIQELDLELRLGDRPKACKLRQLDSILGHD